MKGKIFGAIGLVAFIIGVLAATLPDPYTSYNDNLVVRTNATVRNALKFGTSTNLWSSSSGTNLTVDGSNYPSFVQATNALGMTGTGQALVQAADATSGRAAIAGIAGYPIFTNLVWVHLTNNTYYVSAPWSNSTYRLEFSINATNDSLSTGSYQYNSLRIRTNLNPAEHASGNAVGSISDDIPPLYALGSFFSGDHGWYLGYMTWTSHGASVGNQLKDASGFVFAVTELAGADHFWFATTSTTTVYRAPAAGNLTNVTTAGVATTGNWSATQQFYYPCWNVQTQWFNVDGFTVANGNVIGGRWFEAGMSQTIWNPLLAYSNALGNASFTYAALPALCNRTLRTRFNGNCQITSEDTITSLSTNTWTMGYTGDMQAAPRSTTTTYYWLPNSKAIAGSDLTVPIAAASGVTGNVVYYNNATSIVDLATGLNVFWTFDDTVVSPSTNFTAGHVMLYDPDFFNSSTASRSTLGATSWTIPLSTRKLYPYAIENVTFAIGDTYRTKSYRKWFPSSGTFYTNAIIERDFDALVVTNAYRTRAVKYQ